jgi:hypothetical protein
MIGFEEALNFGTGAVIEYWRNEYFNKMHPFFSSNTPSLHHSNAPTLHYLSNIDNLLLERRLTKNAGF